MMSWPAPRGVNARVYIGSELLVEIGRRPIGPQDDKGSETSSFCRSWDSLNSKGEGELSTLPIARVGARGD